VCDFQFASAMTWAPKTHSVTSRPDSVRVYLTRTVVSATSVCVVTTAIPTADRASVTVAPTTVIAPANV